MALHGRRSDLRRHEIRTQYLSENDTACGGQMKERSSKQVFRIQFGNFLFP